MSICGVFLGIDPGLTGAIAVLIGDRVIVHDMPTQNVKSGKTVKRRIDAAGLQSLAERMAFLDPGLVTIEQVGGMKHDGGSRAFVFGYAAAQVYQAFVSQKLQVRFVPPATWKGKLRVKKGKTNSQALASQLFPASAYQWRRVKDHGRAEAALIAYYGRMKWAN